jgi:hypothetical protein
MFVNNKLLKTKRIPIREKRSSLKKIFIGKGDVKHTNTKVTITFYVFNIERTHLIRDYNLAYKSYYAPLKKEEDESHQIVSLKKYVGIDDEGKFNKDPEGRIIVTYNRPYTLKEFFNTSNDFKLYYHAMTDINLIPKFKLINYYEIYYAMVGSLINKLTTYLKMTVEYYEYLNELVNITVLNNDEKFAIFTDKTGQFNAYKYPEANYYKELAKKNYIKKLTRAWYLLKFNSVKFEQPFILKLKRMVQNLYDKDVEFNIVNLKKMYLNSDIFTQAIALKLRNRENRLYRVLRSSLSRVNLPDVKKITYLQGKPNRDEYLVNKIRNTYINSMLDSDDKVDYLNNLLRNYFPSANSLEVEMPNQRTTKTRAISLKSHIFRHLKHFNLRGIRVEAKGRLTRRFTASRSVFKVR